MLLVSSGLGFVRRGFESFTEECYAALRRSEEQEDLEVWLAKGGGRSGPRERRLWCARRTGWLAGALGAITGRAPYSVEQITFGLRLGPFVSSLRPGVVLFSDPQIGSVLWHWRRRTGGRFRLLFSNGGPFPPPFRKWDHVQQVTPAGLSEAIAAGEPEEKHTLLPYGFHLPAPVSGEEAMAARLALGLPRDRPILLSVGALNATHKRMDHVVREAASLPADRRPFLVLLGQPDEETEGIRGLVHDTLGVDCRVETARPAEMHTWYCAADALVLASVREGFGRVLVEGLARGLTCIAHDGPVQRFVLGGCGTFVDMHRPGEVAAVAGALVAPTEGQRLDRHRRAASEFSWPVLTPAYASMLRRATASSAGPGFAIE